jgi:hypothetical protein
MPLYQGKSFNRPPQNNLIEAALDPADQQTLSWRLKPQAVQRSQRKSADEQVGHATEILQQGRHRFDALLRHEALSTRGAWRRDWSRRH